MKFRIDIQDDKVDLSKFKKAAKVYMSQMPRLGFDIFLKDYKIDVRITQVEGHNQQLVDIRLWDIKRKDDGEIESFNVITPLRDTRFQELKLVKELFEPDKPGATFESTSSEQTANKLELFIRTIFKINNLKAFL